MKSIIPVGPYHPILEEPEYFQIEVEGEKVKNIEINLGGNHRGMEKIAEGKSYIHVMYLIERICGICSMSHPLAYVNACEQIAGVELPVRARYIRTIVAELERLHSHFLWIGLAGHFIGYNTVYMWAWRYREPILDMLEHLGGNRNMYAVNRLGGVTRDITEDDFPAILKLIDDLKHPIDLFYGAVKDDPVIHARLKGVGILTEEAAHNTGALGPTVRGSGIPTDVRYDDPYAAYGMVDWDVVTFPTMDVYARAMVRIVENYESVKIIRHCVDELKKIKTHELLNEVEEMPPGEAVGHAEAPRGETMHYVRSDGSNSPIRHKMRAPTYNNILAYKPMCIGEELADAVLICASVDPCYSCTERVTIIDDKKNERVYSQKELIDLSIAKTEKIKKEIL